MRPWARMLVEAACRRTLAVHSHGCLKPQQSKLVKAPRNFYKSQTFRLMKKRGSGQKNRQTCACYTYRNIQYLFCSKRYGKLATGYSDTHGTVRPMRMNLCQCSRSFCRWWFLTVCLCSCRVSLFKVLDRAHAAKDEKKCLLRGLVMY
jgi:hypothetical protein